MQRNLFGAPTGRGTGHAVRPDRVYGSNFSRILVAGVMATALLIAGVVTTNPLDSPAAAHAAVGGEGTAANRMLFWRDCWQIIGMSDADLDLWHARGVGGFVCQTQHLRGLGGAED